jgi:hypothetical protein
MSEEKSDDLVPDPKVARQYGVHIKTLGRWDEKPELGFARPIYINGRKYRRRGELREFERRAATTLASKATLKT